jgi:chromate transporter
MIEDIAAGATKGAESTDRPAERRGSVLEVLGVSFGGPVAHLGYFREEYVRRRKWISEDAYADLVALCQFLPGPTSSQVGIAIGILRAGLPGAIASWLGFTLPSAILLVAFAFGLQRFGVTDAGWLHGLKIAAAVGFALVPPNEPEPLLLHRGLDSWRGIGDIVAGMARQEYGLE